MKRLALSIPLAAALVAVSSTAFACGPSGPEGLLMVGVVLAPFMAVPYAAFASAVAAAQRKSWFPTTPHRFWSWLKTSVAAWAVASFFALTGMVAAFGLNEALEINDALSATIVFTTPLVGVVAYLMRLHTRRVRG